MSRQFKGHKQRISFAQSGGSPLFDFNSSQEAAPQFYAREQAPPQYYFSGNDYNSNDDHVHTNRSRQQMPNSSSSSQRKKHSKRSSSSSSRQSNTPDIFVDPHSDSLNLQTANYSAAQSFINISGFDDISPFITQPTNAQSSVSSLHDNNFNDYNELGPNNINDSDYRQRMIRQMQRSVFEQSNAMFGHSEKANTSTHPITESTYDASGSYSPSAAPSLYLQQQSKSLFKNIDNK